jgi:hypothetical protein
MSELHEKMYGQNHTRTPGGSHRRNLDARHMERAHLSKMLMN